MNAGMYLGVLPLLFSDWRTWVTVGFAIAGIVVLRLIAVPGVKRKKKLKVPRVKAVPQAKEEGAEEKDGAKEDLEVNEE